MLFRRALAPHFSAHEQSGIKRLSSSLNFISKKERMSNRAKIVAIPTTTTTTFSPTSITGCSLWLDGADATTLTQAGGTVSQWSDKSGNARHITQATTGNQPTYSSTSNAVVFTGNQYLNIPTALAATTPVYNIFVVERRASANVMFFIGQYNAMTGNTALILGYNATNVSHHTTAHITDCQVTIPSYAGASEPTKLNRYSYTGSTRSTSINGGSLSTSQSFSATLTTWTNPNVGIGFGTIYGYIGNIHEIIFYNATLTNTQQQTIEGYLAQKWGLTASLPAGHLGLTTTIFVTPTLAPPIQKIRTIPRAGAFTNFLPTSITGCALWFDAADATTFTLNGSTVASWRDKSGNGYSVGQATTSNQPTYATNILNGLPGIQLSLSTYLYQVGSSMPAFASASAITVFMVAKNGSTYSSAAWNLVNTMWFTGVDVATSRYHFSFALGSTPGVTIYPNQGAVVPLGSNALIGFTLAASGVSVNVNGSLTTFGGSTPTSASDSTWFMFGDARNIHTTDVNIYEFIGFTTTLTTTQRQTVESYLAQKWGLTASLPVGHPGLTTTVYGTTAAPTVRQKIRYIAPSVAIVVAPTVYTVTTSGLVYYLDAAQTASYPGSGSTWSNLVGSGNAVTLYNSPTYSASGGGSLLFNGTSQYGKTASAINLPQWTLEAWFNYNGTGGANIVVDNYPPSVQYSLGGFGNGLICANIWTVAGTPNYVLVNNTWYHIVGAYNGSTLRLYINGRLVYSVTATSTPSNGGVSVNIMTQYDTGSFLGGNLAVLRMYNRGLTVTEVNGNYNAERARFSLPFTTTPISYTIPSVSFTTSGLSCYFDMSIQACYYSAGAPSLYDLTGSGIAVTLYNSPTYSTTGGGSLVFDGSTQYGRSSVPLLLPNWTMEAWYYYNGGSTSGNIVVDIYPGSIQYYLGGFGNGWLSTGVWNFGKYTAAYSSMVSGNWYHVAGTYDGTNVILYINGVRVYSNACSGTPTSSGIGFQIMTQYDTGHSQYVAGNLAILRMYNRGLSATEINTNYNAERARFSLAYVSPPISYTIPSVSFSTSGLSFYIDIAIQASYYNSSATTLYDLTGSSMVITLYNSPTYSTSGGGCLIFNGTTQYGRSSAPLPLTNWTIEAWYYYSGGSTGGNIVIDMFSSSMQYILGSFGGGWISAGMYNPNAYTGSFTPTVGNWYQVVGTYDGANVKLYINGALSSSVASTGRPANGGIGFQIMTQYDVGHSQYLAGNLAILRMYNRALILSEVTQNYNAENSRFTPT